MIKNDVFNHDSMLKLINTTFFFIKKLQAPYRDEETLESKKKILNTEHTKIVSTFIIEVNKCIDNINKDLEKYLQVL